MPTLMFRRCAEHGCGRFLGLRVSLRPWRGWIGGVSHGICAACMWLRYGVSAGRES